MQSYKRKAPLSIYYIFLIAVNRCREKYICIYNAAKINKPGPVWLPPWVFRI